MPLSFIHLYVTLALALSAVFTVPFVTIPAFADSSDTIRLGFLDSIDDPSQLLEATAKSDDHEGQSQMQADIDENSGAWQRGLSPVWMWLPAPEPAVIASR